MAQAITRAPMDLWWVGILQGVAAILFGIAAVFWPGLTLVTLVYLFGAFVLAWGLISILSGILSMQDRGNWWLTLIFGVVGLGVGLYLVRNPDASFNTLILLIGFTLVVRGLLDVLEAFTGEVTATTKVLWLLMGAAAIIVGIVVLNQPVAGGVAFVWLLGLYALFFGPLMIAMSLDAHKEFDELQVASKR